MVLEDAFEQAQRFLDEVIRPEHQSEIVVCRCEEIEEGWSFGYLQEAAAFRDGERARSPVVPPATMPRESAGTWRSTSPASVPSSTAPAWNGVVSGV